MPSGSLREGLVSELPIIVQTLHQFLLLALPYPLATSLASSS